MEKVVIADNVWILVATALVFLMSIPGLALFYSGLSKVKSILNTTMMVLVAFCVVSLLWIAYGYSLTFGQDIGGIIGSLSYAFLNGINPTDPAPAAENLYHYLFIFFQMTFAAITVALMAGAFVERMKFSAWILVSILWFTFVYAPVAHWIWGGGFLSEWGVLDFAGGLVVHETCGIGALIGAFLLGSRKEPIILPASLPIAVVGTGLLWFGWFGFNGGSALAMNNVAISAAFGTTMAALTGGLTWMTLEWIKFGKPTTLGLITGFIAGLATITPASGFVDIWAAVLIGFAGGLFCFLAVVYVKNRFKYDDSLDVFGVHGVGGMLGAFLLSFLAKPSVNEVSGLFFGGSFSFVLVQIAGIAVVGIYTAVVTFVIFKVVSTITGIRLTIAEETTGIDEIVHGEKAYNREY